jgi:hypothetical protein
MNMNTVSTFEKSLECLSMEEMKDALPSQSFTRSQKCSRAALKEAVTSLSQEDHTAIVNAAKAKKRRQTEQDSEGQHNVQNHRAMSDDVFFETVPGNIRGQCIAKFIDATGNGALATGICAVCAGRFYSQGMNDMLLSKLQTDNKLVPSVAHSAHVLTEGMLLHSRDGSIQVNDEGARVARTCAPCTSSLQKKKMPAMSLANGMWIGDVPLELKILTLPERILVAHHFPAAYIVKLYPKKKGARMWAGSEGLHSGLQGNVSTYRLNMSDVANMTGDKTMLPPSHILAAMVGVTFVGPGNLPEKTLPGFLRVNRRRVCEALEWLKKNNPLYAEIEVSTERLNELPSDDVPFEISSLACHSANESLLADEMDGYVPEDGEGEGGGRPGGQTESCRLRHANLNYDICVERGAAAAGVINIEDVEVGEREGEGSSSEEGMLHALHRFMNVIALLQRIPSLCEPLA